MPKFCSAFVRPKVAVTSAGELTRPEYYDKVESNGSISVCEKDVPLDLYKLIQSSKEDCLLYSLMDKYVGTDLSFLNFPNGVYADVRADQTSYAEHCQRAINAERAFYDLPPQLRKQFDNDLGTFLEKIQTEEGAKLVGDFIKLNQSKFVAPITDSDIPDPKGDTDK